MKLAKIEGSCPTAPHGKTPRGNPVYKGKINLSQYTFFKDHNFLFKNESPCVGKVFALFIFHLNNPSEKFGFWHKEKRWITKTYEEIAEELSNYHEDYRYKNGSSPRNVRRAIYRLEKIGVVISMRAAFSQKFYTIDTKKLRELYPKILFKPLSDYEELLAKMATPTGQDGQNNKEENKNLKEEKDNIYVPSHEEGRKEDPVPEVPPPPPPLEEPPASEETAQKMLDIWNEKVQTERLNGFTNPLKPNKDRLKLLAKALNDHFKGEIDEWKYYCRLIRSSGNCLGKNKSGWIAKLEWCLKESTIEGIYNGEYGVQNIPRLTVVSSEPLDFKEHTKQMEPWERNYREALMTSLEDATFKSWILPLHFDRQENHLNIVAPTRFMRDWISTHYSCILENTAKNLLGVEYFEYFEHQHRMIG